MKFILYPTTLLRVPLGIGHATLSIKAGGSFEISFPVLNVIKENWKKELLG